MQTKTPNSTQQSLSPTQPPRRQRKQLCPSNLSMSSRKPRWLPAISPPRRKVNCPSSRGTSSQSGVKSRAAREKKGTSFFGSAKLALMSRPSRAGFSNLRAYRCISFRILNFAHTLPIRMEQGLTRQTWPGRVLVPSSCRPEYVQSSSQLYFDLRAGASSTATYAHL
jgi:hypothetical protein